MGFYVREYNRRAKAILNDAIKTAIFIDENALEPYHRETKNGRPDVVETEKLTKKIFRHFNNRNVSFEIHKFKGVDTAKKKIRNKDIVLLDWHLDGETSGEEYALELLEEIVKEDQIHFCCIYTNSPKEGVLNNCLSYFSGYTKQFCDAVREEYQVDDEVVAQIKPFLDMLLASNNPNDRDEIVKVIKKLRTGNGIIDYINEIEPIRELSLSNKVNCLLYASKPELIKSPRSETPKIDFLSKKDFTFIIGNTVIIILNKDHANDSRELFSKIKNEIIKRQNSYLLMLGLELQNQIKKSSAFINGNVLDVQNKTIAYHWAQSISNENGIGFSKFIKQVLTEQISNNIDQYDFSLLNETNFLKTNDISKQQDPEQLSKINTFYNGSTIKNDKPLSYGDIFYCQANKSYYLCITALCDCLHPKNIKNKFFFVEGKKLKINRAIDLSDEAFISYIDDKTSISWVQLGKGSKNDQHKPVYIKPIQLFIPETNITDGKLKVNDWENTEQKVSELELEYKFTLRQNYTQRIANHAFSHPIRVGIDFVKKNNI